MFIGSGRRIRTCRLVINSHPRPPRAPDRKKRMVPKKPAPYLMRGEYRFSEKTMRSEMVEQRGNAPRTAILQGSPAPLCLPRWWLARRASRAAPAPNWWSDGVTLPARRSCEDRLHTCARPIGARTWFRATLSCASGRRCHQISFPGKVGADAGNRNRAFGVALRNSTVELHPRCWWAGTESNGHRLCGAFTAPWARQCPACP